jgi:hypothetical protein
MYLKDEESSGRIRSFPDGSCLALYTFVALAHLSTAAVFAFSLGHFVSAAARGAFLAAGSAFFTAIGFRRIALFAATGAILTTGSAFFAAIGFRRIALLAAAGAIFTAGSSIFAAGSSCLGIGWIIDRSRGRRLRPHADGEQ